jgi:hypothetical protein
MADTLQVHGDPTLCLLGLEDARAAWLHPYQGDVKWAFDYERESCETTDRLIASTVLLELKAGLGQAPPRPGHARGQDLQGVHPVGGHTQQDDSVIRGGAFQGCSRRQQAGS